MPYAQWKNPKVQLKMSYLDTKNKQGILPFNGRDWYNQEASRAINQAIGRVIRHRYDYGLILLIDERDIQTSLQEMKDRNGLEIQ